LFGDPEPVSVTFTDRSRENTGKDRGVERTVCFGNAKKGRGEVSGKEEKT